MTDQMNMGSEEEERELPEIDPSTLDVDDDDYDDEDDGLEDLEAIEPVDSVEEPLTLIDDEEMDRSTSKITAAGHGALHAAATEFKRPLNINGAGATRCKVFHSKISPVPLEYMEKQINEWLDSTEAEVKFVSKVVGVMEGKRPEPNVIVTLWY